MTAALPFRSQLLKWVGNKQRFAHEIVSYFPAYFGTYYEPFLGSGGVLGTLAPGRAVASDLLGPLMQIWQTLAHDPDTLKRWYAEVRARPKVQAGLAIGKFVKEPFDEEARRNMFGKAAKEMTPEDRV